MNTCDNCGDDRTVDRLVLTALIRGKSELVVINCDAVMRQGNPLHLCRPCLVKVVTEAEQAEQAKKSKIGFSS